MNQPENSSYSGNPKPSATAATPPELPPVLPNHAGAGHVLEALLKRPAPLIQHLQASGTAGLTWWLAAIALLALAAYGVVVGGFAGGEQLLAAPLKIAVGALLSMLICFPSLFIFACISGADVTLRGTLAVLTAILALTSVLLIGFAPVAWVFSQSTESVAFIGALHLVIWLISLGFGLRLLGRFTDALRVRDRLHLRVWSLMVILVTLQMTTALRPIVGTAPERLPSEKKFFLEYWFENLTATSPAQS